MEASGLTRRNGRGKWGRQRAREGCAAGGEAFAELEGGSRMVEDGMFVARTAAGSSMRGNLAGAKSWAGDTARTSAELVRRCAP